MNALFSAKALILSMVIELARSVNRPKGKFSFVPVSRRGFYCPFLEYLSNFVIFSFLLPTAVLQWKKLG